MIRIMIFLAIVMLVLVAGCGSQDKNKYKVYRSSWDGNPIIVKQLINDEYEVVNEITDANKIKKLIGTLEKADWEENVQVDIEPAHYYFTWNSFKHYVWVNQEVNRLELVIEGQSNYGTLSTEASEVVFEILTDKKFDLR